MPRDTAQPPPAALGVTPAPEDDPDFVCEAHRVALGDGRIIVVRVHCEYTAPDLEPFVLGPTRRAATYTETVSALRALAP